MTKPEIGYSDALDALITLSPALKGAVYSVSISGTETAWGLDVQGPDGQSMQRLIRHIGAHEAPDKAHRSDKTSYRIWLGVVGRVPVRVVCESTIIRRVSGRV